MPHIQSISIFAVDTVEVVTNHEDGCVDIVLASADRVGGARISVWRRGDLDNPPHVTVKVRENVTDGEG